MYGRQQNWGPPPPGPPPPFSGGRGPPQPGPYGSFPPAPGGGPPPFNGAPVPPYGQAPPPPPNYGPVYGGGGAPQYSTPPAPPVLPPMPPPDHPSYPAWYKQWHEAHGQNQPGGGGIGPAGGGGVGSSVYNHLNRPPPGPPPAKKANLSLSAPPPPPPPPAEAPPPDSTAKAPSYMAAKKGAVIYSTPRPPTPEPPKPVGPPDSTPEPVPQSRNLFEAAPPPSPPPPPKPKMQWFYDGASWVYTDKQPEVKTPPSEKKAEFQYSGARNQNPVAAAVMKNMRGGGGGGGPARNKWGKIIDPNKPKATPVRCEDCNLTVTCQTTYETHVNGKAHKKRLAQNKIMKAEKARAESARLAQVALAVKKAELATEGKTIAMPELLSEERVKEGQEEEAQGFLQKQINGDYMCVLCSVRMNSLDCAKTHMSGQKHRKNEMSSGGGRRGGRGGGRSGRGGHHAAAAAGQTREQMRAKDAERNSEARAEYDRVFADKMAGNADLETAEVAALNAMNAVLNGTVTCSPTRPTAPIVVPGVTIAPNLNISEPGTWPPPGITVIKEPKGFKPGEYRCEACEVVLSSEPILEVHLNSSDHKEADMTSISLKKPNSGGIFRGRRGGGGNTMHAQRGRRGLISGGEMMPDKLNKNERREQRDIASSIANHLAKQTGEVKVLPLLMNFVKGETIKPEEGSEK